jgi:hypothetical protein
MRRNRMKRDDRKRDHHPDRRTFMKGGVLAAGVATAGAGLLAGRPLSAFAAFGEEQEDGPDITDGDVAILRFLAAAEILESDLWQQYNELGGGQTYRDSPKR